MLMEVVVGRNGGRLFRGVEEFGRCDDDVVLPFKQNNYLLINLILLTLSFLLLLYLTRKNELQQQTMKNY